MRPVSPNYFVCTLDQASSVNAESRHRFSSVNTLVDRQAEIRGSCPAAAFHQPDAQVATERNRAGQHAEKSSVIYTFKDLRVGSISTATILQAGALQPYLGTGHTVALLCRSTPVFLFTWLGLMRAGASVLLIAPQCPPGAISHLCQTCEVRALLYDPSCSKLAKDATSKDKAFECFEIPFGWDSIQTKLLEATDQKTDWPEVDEHDIAYLHHTSGTSTGLPKPIPQTHRAAVGVLPCLDGTAAATFTTTPLYHGGIADSLRSWTSGALIWLFPESIPITSENILVSVALADKSAQSRHLPPVKYFSSVPYILQMLASDERGIVWLQGMDLVGVGGAALPEEVGDDLVRQSIKLVSRFGSAECGFLLSSSRNHDTDKAWQYLRPWQETQVLRFEPRDNGLSELIVLRGWPHLSKTNREDGSYATADLFAPHPSIPNAWRYHSRADSQLTLITGKKFDPAPMEDALAVNPLLNDVFVFGDGKQYPGIMLWPSSDARGKGPSEVTDAIWPEINRLNAKAALHARIKKNMLVVHSLDAQRPERSSKGTLLRKAVEKRYAESIEQAYQNKMHRDDAAEDYDLGSESGILALVQSIIRTNTGRDELPVDADLFSLGFDSVECIQLRSELEVHFGGQDDRKLPFNLIYDCGTLRELARYMLARRAGESVAPENELFLMSKLVETYGVFDRIEPITGPMTTTSDSTAGQTYLLTGATGSLATHVLDQLLKQDTVRKVVCLVRSTDESTSFERVSRSLNQRKCTPVTEGSSKVICIPAQFGERQLGLTDKIYQSLATEVDVVIHAAWAVNFNARLRSFEKDQINGLHNLIAFALSSPKLRPPRFLFCSSTASVIASKAKQQGILETTSNDPNDASPLGYSRSKWVAEAICARAAAQTRLKGLMHVIRVGQLCGDTKYGIWNMKEAWPLMLTATRLLKAVPDLGREPLRWLPVDLAAESLIQIATTTNASGGDSVQVWHVLRQGGADEPTWNDAVQWMKDEVSPEPLWVVSLPLWVAKLQGLEQDHAAKKLLGLWKAKADADGHGIFNPEEEDVRFDQGRTLAICPYLNERGNIDRGLFAKLWQWVHEQTEKRVKAPVEELSK